MSKDAGAERDGAVDNIVACIIGILLLIIIIGIVAGSTG